MNHITETFHEGMDMHTVVECVHCHKRISAKHFTSDAQWQRSVKAFLEKYCVQTQKKNVKYGAEINGKNNIIG